MNWNCFIEVIYLILIIVMVGCWIGMQRRNARIRRRIDDLQRYNEMIIQARRSVRGRD